MIEKIRSFLQVDRYVYLLLALIGITIYANVIKGPFFFDDYSLIVDNKYLRSFAYLPSIFTENVEAGSNLLSNIYRPVENLIHMLIFNIFGLNASVYHLLNIFLHIINSCLIFKIFKKLNFEQTISSLMAILFLVHPVQAESVSYISGLPDVLGSLLILLPTLLFIKHPKSEFTKKHCIGISTLLIIALLTKESAVVLAPILLLITLLQYKQYSKKELGTRLILLFILGLITAGFLALKFTVFNFYGENQGLFSDSNYYSENMSIRIVYFLDSLWEYAKMLFYPIDLFFEKQFIFHFNLLFVDDSWVIIKKIINYKTLFGAMLVIGGTTLSIISLKRTKNFLLGFGWFMLALVPVSGILIAVNAPFKEHWLYIPLVGLLILPAQWFSSIKNQKTKTLFSIICIILSLLFAARTIVRNQQWSNPVAFFEHELQYSEMPRIYLSLGNVYLHQGQYDLAKGNFEIALKKSRKKSDDSYLGLAKVNIINGNQPAALEEIYQALRINPRSLEALHLLSDHFSQPELSKLAKESIKKINDKQTVTPEEITEAFRPHLPELDPESSGQDNTSHPHRNSSP